VRGGAARRRLLNLAELAAKTERAERNILAAAQHRLRVVEQGQHNRDRDRELALLVLVIDRATSRLT